jgi:hypothetical protein
VILRGLPEGYIRVLPSFKEAPKKKVQTRTPEKCLPYLWSRRWYCLKGLVCEITSVCMYFPVVVGSLCLFVFRDICVVAAFFCQIRHSAYFDVST